MDFFSCGSTCRPRDPTSDTVRFDAAAIGAVPPACAEQDLHAEAERAALARRRELEAQQQLIEQERRRQDEEAAEERAHQEREAQLKREQEEEEAQHHEARARAERMREAREARATAEREEHLRLKEETRLAEEEQEAARRAAAQEAARRAEALRLEQELARKAAVAAFLKAHGFIGGACGAKKNLMNSTYPLHRAAKTGNSQMVEYLLLEGANAMQTNSAGRTAAQVAQRHDSKDSHTDVLRLLGTSGVRRAGGA
mmetsp:Transcript_27262/g.69908  ORF Transcript_27262/g.69908 Transcript_27262/m.69908 type:complete len:256 (-) Transcript_27262:126-893(-)|eukprot:CAMPEP_0183601958 /NCGR_PEP_ID=MMETSP0371-20130417/180704_1 /TAXON_ID=268820 /ORGANISM="Peridinium aciculiferum, Strain PAER-2" /LENGTH=255 /DNA_ID=CAMNT_0025814051 /DNA_START=72 /DNA_END=839 /DNA_ORIENTATION=+